MGDSHFRERSHEKQRDEGAEHVAEDDAVAGQVPGQGTAEKQPGSDRAADGDHAQLPAGQAARELFAALNLR